MKGAGETGFEIYPSRIKNEIHPHVYGHFLEHIYHSVVDGLCGEQVRNRTFVPVLKDGWRVCNGVLEQPSNSKMSFLMAGSPVWKDYEYTLEARETNSGRGMIVLFRVKDKSNFYWWSLSGLKNKESMAGSMKKGGRNTWFKKEKEKWYKIRIRVKGSHVRGWLDNTLSMDVKDETYKNGGVGVGTHSSAAQFRNMEVRALDGKLLWKGPEGIVGPNMDVSDMSDWSVIRSKGGGKIKIVKNDAYNSGTAVQIEPDGQSRCGISQDRFYVQAGWNYNGWMRIRGVNFSGKLCVSLSSDSGEILDQKEWGKLPKSWEVLNFGLNCGKTNTNAKLSITAEGKGKVVVDTVSLMSERAIKLGGFRPDLFEAAKALKPTIIRWPGGCFASIYRWKDNIGPQWARKPFYNSVWGEWDDASFGTDEYMRLCRALDAEPLVVLNIGSWAPEQDWKMYLKEALEWIEYLNGGTDTPMGKLRAKNGHPEPYNVTHIELDNETWGMGLDGYADRMKKFIPEIRKRWPDLKLYACAFFLPDDKKMLELVGKDIDILSYHFYHNPDDFATGPKFYGDIWDKYDKLIKKSNNPDIKLGITEWNAQSTDWRTGLFVAGFLIETEKRNVVQMATPALWLRRTDAEGWDNAFINHDHYRWFPAPNYVVMKLFSEHYQPYVVAMDDVDKRIMMIATRDKNCSLLVVKAANPTNETIDVAVKIKDFNLAQNADSWLIASGSPGDRNTLENPDKIKSKKSTLKTQGNKFVISLPAYSVCVVEGKMKKRRK